MLAGLPRDFPPAGQDPGTDPQEEFRRQTDTVLPSKDGNLQGAICSTVRFQTCDAEGVEVGKQSQGSFTSNHERWHRAPGGHRVAYKFTYKTLQYINIYFTGLQYINM